MFVVGCTIKYNNLSFNGQCDIHIHIYTRMCACICIHVKGNPLKRFHDGYHCLWTMGS